MCVFILIVYISFSLFLFWTKSDFKTICYRFKTAFLYKETAGLENILFICKNVNSATNMWTENETLLQYNTFRMLIYNILEKVVKNQNQIPQISVSAIVYLCKTCYWYLSSI
jgi:hypothetical protein